MRRYFLLLQVAVLLCLAGGSAAGQTQTVQGIKLPTSCDPNARTIFYLTQDNGAKLTGYYYCKSDTQQWTAFDLTSPPSPGLAQPDVPGIARQTVFNVKEAPYSATGNGTTDDTLAIQAAIDAAQAVKGTVLLPYPAVAYKLTSTLTINSSVTFKMEGSHDRNNVTFSPDGNFTVNYSAVPSGNCLRWAGGASPMMVVAGVKRARLENVCLDGADIATVGIKFDRLLDSTVTDLTVIRVTGGSNGIAMMLGSSKLLHDGSARNKFSNIYLQGESALYIGPFDGGQSGAFLNVFDTLTCEHTGATEATQYGIYINSGDNNHFYSVLASSHVAGVSDRSVWFGPSGTYPGTWNPNKAYSNFFHGLTAEKVYVDADSPYTGAIENYDTANTANEPIIGAGSKLSWSYAGLNFTSNNNLLFLGSSIDTDGYGRFKGGVLNGAGFIQTGATIMASGGPISPGLHTIVIYTGGAGGTLTLPASSLNVGNVVSFNNAGTGSANIVGTGADVIGWLGNSSVPINTTTRSITLWSDGGTGWFQIGR